MCITNFKKNMRKAKFCIDCGNEGTVERKRCSDCAVKYNRERVYAYNKKLRELGIKTNRYGIINCCICNEKMIKNRPNQVAHGKCRNRNITSYNIYPRDSKGMMMGRKVVFDLGILIPKKTVVHHVDENPLNNSLDNLMIMSSSNHSKLHGFIRGQWVINKGIYGDKLESVWRKILIKLNFIWIEKTNNKLILINDCKTINIENDKIYTFT